MTVTYCDTSTAAIYLKGTGATANDITASYKTEGHFKHVMPLVTANGALMWRLSLIQALVCEARLTSGGAQQ